MLAVGKKAPAFWLESSRGGKLRLSELLGKWVVLYAYPRDNTPGCTREAEGFRDAAAELDALGAVVLGVSKDSIASHLRFGEKLGLDFILLSDPEAKMLEKYGAWGEKTMYGKKRMGILRSTFLIDPKGKLVHVWPKVRVKGHVAEVMGVLRELAG
ncbi:MAG: peroxiredoxin [Deltaproteobacteria bacterium]|nr:peroxiredoxin [Deltaproteobacteria bacterium]